MWDTLGIFKIEHFFSFWFYIVDYIIRSNSWHLIINILFYFLIWSSNWFNLLSNNSFSCHVVHIKEVKVKLNFDIISVRSWFSDRAHYNEFVESGSKSWALIRQWLVLGVKSTQNWATQRPREKGPLAQGRESPTPLGYTGTSFLSLGLSQIGRASCRERVLMSV